MLELTEREAIRDADRLRNMLLAIQNAGVRVAADDVGAGNAGLRLLSQFRFDVVKIDLSLIQRAGDDGTHSVLRSIVEVAERMGATTTAEGVETSAQLRTARRLGITGGQGYLLGRPGTDIDLSWVDIAALEQRDDVGIPVTADPVQPIGVGTPRAATADRRAEAPRWTGAGPVDDADNPLLPPLDATGHLTGPGAAPWPSSARGASSSSTSHAARAGPQSNVSSQRSSSGVSPRPPNNSIRSRVAS